MTLHGKAKIQRNQRFLCRKGDYKYEIDSKRNTAEIYEYGDNLICKLFYPQYPTKIIEHEFCNATMAWKLGIRTPKAHRLIMEDERKGIIYDRIVGEILSVKFNESSERVYDEWMDEFVDFHKQLMQHNIDDVISYKDFLKMFATDEETIAKINALADGVIVIALFMAISIWKM